MPLDSVTHLHPRMQPVAVGAQEAKVSFVCIPIPESVRPRPATAFFSYFCGLVDMVNVKNAMVSLAARRTLAAEVCYQGHLSSPVSWMAILFVSCSIPVFIAASRRTVFVLCLFAAYMTWLARTPSVCQVTSVTAKLAVTLLDLIGANIKRFAAMAADTFNLGIFSHSITNSEVTMLSLYHRILRDCRTADSPTGAGT